MILSSRPYCITFQLFLTLLLNVLTSLVTQFNTASKRGDSSIVKIAVTGSSSSKKGAAPFVTIIFWSFIVGHPLKLV